MIARILRPPAAVTTILVTLPVMAAQPILPPDAALAALTAASRPDGDALADLLEAGEPRRPDRRRSCPGAAVDGRSSSVLANQGPSSSPTPMGR